MKAITCEVCGSNQLIKKDAFFQCEYCGTKYTLEEAKKLLISGTIEITKGEAEKERYINNITNLININQIGKAYQLLDDFVLEYPADYRGWWLLYKLPFLDFIINDNNLSFPEIKYSKELDNAYKFHNLDKEYDDLWNMVSNSYFKKCNNPKFNFKSLLENKEPQIPNKYFFNIKQDIIKKMQESHIVIDALDKNISNNAAFKLLENHGVDKQTIKLLKSEVKKRKEFNNSASFVNISISPFTKIIGNTLYWYEDCWDHNISHYYTLSNPISFKELNLCQYCGGSFKGIFTKVCSKCGKPKDY